MATKKKSALDVLAELRSEANKDSMVIGSLAEFDMDVKAISTGNLALDFLTGIGGYPRGRIVEQFGLPSSGKTTSSLMAMATAQRECIEAGEGVVMFLDYERSIDPAYCAKLGLDTSHETFVYVQPANLEEGVNLFRRLLDTGEVRMAVFDSVAAMVSKKELEAETGAITVADRAKAQPLTAKILTPSGWETMGDMKEGKQVMTPSGRVAEVVAVHPAEGLRSVYRVTCDDGSVTEASGDHWWEIRTGTPSTHGSAEPKLVTTEEMKALVDTGKRWKRAYLPAVSVDFAAVEHVISPYAMGSLLGDGHLAPNHGASLIAHVSDADEQFTYVRDGLPEWVELRFINGVRPSIREVRLIDTSWAPGRGRTNRLCDELARLGVRGSIHHQKHIPDEYMFDSRENRIELLRGLMDTDGTLRGEKVSGVFSTVSSRLADQVADLVRSLGGDASISHRPSMLNGTPTGRTAYKVSVRTSFSPFRLARKSSQWRAPSLSRKRRVVSVEYVREDVVQCIEIDDPQHLYLTDGLIPTHNSMHQVCRQITGAVSSTGCCVIFLNHTMELVDATPMGQKLAARGIKRMTQPGGKALPFYASLRIEFKRIGDVKTKDYDALTNSSDDDTVSGQRVQATVVKNKAGVPFRTTELRVRRDHGFSQQFAVLDVLVSHKAVGLNSTGWYEWPRELLPESLGDKGKGDTYKVRGEDNMLKRLESDPEWMTLAHNRAKEILEEHGMAKVDGSDYDSNGISVDVETGEVHE